MCLINELARFNRLGHQYRLMDESGPAHKRIFTVCLRLGGSDLSPKSKKDKDAPAESSSESPNLEPEEYLASGPSIKKAQHAAAAMALEKTKLKHPPPKQKQEKNGIP